MAKSRLDIEDWVPPPAFDDLDKYSHIWVLFVFHKNTNTSTLLKSNMDKGVTFPVRLPFLVHCRRRCVRLVFMDKARASSPHAPRIVLHLSD